MLVLSATSTLSVIVLFLGMADLRLTHLQEKSCYINGNNKILGYPEEISKLPHIGVIIKQVEYGFNVALDVCLSRVFLFLKIEKHFKFQLSPRTRASSIVSLKYINTAMRSRMGFVNAKWFEWCA